MDHLSYDWLGDFSEAFPKAVDEPSDYPPKLSLFKQQSYDCDAMDFDPPSTQQRNPTPEIYDIFQDQTTNNVNNKKVTKRSQQKVKPSQRDYKKNICRNILRHAIKSMITCNVCSEYIHELVDDGNCFMKFYNKILESITGFRVLKDQLIGKPNESVYVHNRKQAFRYYLTWYLKTRASQMILLGEAQNQREYIKYKNEVLLYYVQHPTEWNSNQPEWKDRIGEYPMPRCWDGEIIQHS